MKVDFDDAGEKDAPVWEPCSGQGVQRRTRRTEEPSNAKRIGREEQEIKPRKQYRVAKDKY